jgi:tRNA-splicing ligase RtcB
MDMTEAPQPRSLSGAMETITPRLLSWASILEDSTREQALRTAEMPFIRPHLALMPDAHLVVT